MIDGPTVGGVTPGQETLGAVKTTTTTKNKNKNQAEQTMGGKPVSRTTLTLTQHPSLSACCLDFPPLLGSIARNKTSLPKLFSIPEFITAPEEKLEHSAHRTEKLHFASTFFYTPKTTLKHLTYVLKAEDTAHYAKPCVEPTKKGVLL